MEASKTVFLHRYDTIRFTCLVVKRFRTRMQFCDLFMLNNPYYRKDIELIEKVQRRTTRMRPKGCLGN